MSVEPEPTEVLSPSQQIDLRIKSLGDWKGEALAKVRALIKAADPEVVETMKWAKPSNDMSGVPVWEHNGIICTGEHYKDKVKFTFAKGASISDPKNVFNSSLDGNARRALDLFEDSVLDEGAFIEIIRAAVQLNSAKKPSMKK